MEDEFDGLSKEMIVGASADGQTRSIQVWREGDLAVAQHSALGGSWVIVVVASGDMMPMAFDEPESAIAAMRDLAPMRNRWVPMESGSFIAENQQQRFLDIGNKHGANWFVSIEDREPILRNSLGGDN